MNRRTKHPAVVTGTAADSDKHRRETWPFKFTRALDGGSGRFEHASGRITSTFTLTDDGEVADEQHGLIFLHDNREEQS